MGPREQKTKTVSKNKKKFSDNGSNSCPCTPIFSSKRLNTSYNLGSIYDSGFVSMTDPLLPIKLNFGGTPPKPNLHDNPSSIPNQPKPEQPSKSFVKLFRSFEVMSKKTASLLDDSVLSAVGSDFNAKSPALNEPRSVQGRKIKSISGFDIGSHLDNRSRAENMRDVNKSRSRVTEYVNKTCSFFEEKNNKSLPTSDSPSYFKSKYQNTSCKILGSGAFGTVYEVKCDEFGDENGLSAVKRALKSIKEVHNHEILDKHPNVVRFHRAWLENKQELYIQMELCRFSCELLKDVFTSFVENSNSQLVLLVDCCRGLVHLHQSGILHLDVKPANILFGLDNNFKLGDFGCSVSGAEQFKPGMHVDGGFEAPELSTGHVTSKADVFALGESVRRLTCERVWKNDADLAGVVGEMKAREYMERPNASDILKNKYLQSKDIFQFRMDIKVTLPEMKSPDDDDEKQKFCAAIQRQIERSKIEREIEQRNMSSPSHSLFLRSAEKKPSSTPSDSQKTAKKTKLF